MSVLSLKNLSCGYSGKPCVHDISLTIKSGSITVLLGPNGSGKTTLVRGMTRILKPFMGSVDLDGTDIWKYSVRMFSRKIAYVSQNTELTWPFTVREFVTMGRYPYNGMLSPVSDDTIIHKVMAETGILHFADTPLTRLSGGEFQRSMIARALCQEPEILILDEPVSHLDLHYQLSLIDELTRLAASGTGICISLHDLNLAARFADQIVLLDKGAVILKGDTAGVLTQDVIESVYKVRVSVIETDGRISIIPK